MANFVLIDKKSLNEISVDTSNINLTAPSSVHTKLYRNEVSEFIQDGNNLILKLKNGKTIVVKNFFIVKGELESELVFEDTTGMPWLPYLLGGAAAAGAIAALASDSDGGDNNTTTNTPPGVVAGKEKQPTTTGENKPKTGNITDVKDPDGDQLTYKVTTQPKNGTVTIDSKTGEYTYTPNKGFNGDDTFTVTVDDGKGGTTTIEVPVSVIPAAEVEVTGYEDNVGNAPENIASGKSTNDNKPVISGIAKNAEAVEVTITDAQGKVVKTLTVPVSKDGKWATPELPDALKDGDYTITAKAKDALGNEVASKEYTVTVDTTAPQVEVEVGIDGKITVTYPKDVDPSTVDPNTIEVTDKDGNKVPGITFTGPDADGTFTGQVPTGVDGDVTVKVPAGSYEDKAGNSGLEGKDTVTIPDTTAPQVEVEVGIDGKITVTYPKDVDPSTVDPNTIEVTDKDGNKVPGITFTGPDADGTFTGQVPTGVDGDVTVKVPAGSYEDKAGNSGLEGKDTVTIPDTTAPQVEVEVGIDGKITVTYPKDVDPSTVDPNTIEVTDKDGNKVPGITFTGPDADGTFTGQVPTGVDGDVTVKVPAGSYEDKAGNPGLEGKDAVMIPDTTAPQVEVEVGIDGKITVTYPKDVDPSTVDPNTIEVTDKDGNKVPGITFTGPDADGTFTGQVPTGVDGDVTVKVPAGSYEDKAGNPGLEGKDTVTIPDTTAPTVAVVVNADGTVDFIFSEAVKGFDVSDITVANGTLSGLTQDPTDPTKWIANWTPAADFEGDVTVVVNDKSYTDLAGNEGSGNSGLITVDTKAPTVDVTIDPKTGEVTIDFSELVNGFDPNNVVVENGTLTGLTQDPTDPTIWTGTFVPTPGVEGIGKVTVPGGYTDEAGNPGLEGKDTVTIPDTTAPTVAVVVNADGTVDFIFSEAVKGFDASDITVANGTLSGLTQDPTDPTKWTANWTPAADFEGDVTVVVTDKSYTDLAGNEGSGNSGLIAVDTKAPTVDVVVNADGTVDFIFSEEVTDFDLRDIAVVNGDVNNLVKVPNSNTWTANWTPKEDFEGDVTVVVNDKSYTDLAGNEGSGNSGFITVDTKTPIEKVDKLAVVEDEPHSGKIISKNLAGNLTYTLDPKNGPTHGKVVFDSNDPSKYTYIPDENYSGNDSFKVIVNDDKGGKTVIEVPVTIEAVADAPSITESMEFDVGELALNKYVWNNINGKITIGGKEYEFDGSKTGGNGSGNGINPKTLVEGINALLANKDKDGERKPAVEDQTTILKDPDVKAGSAVLINGLVYLEEGKTYTYKGQADDSGMIIIGNGLSSQYVSWAGPTGGQHSSVFTVEKTGFYDFNLYVHNETGKGNFDFKVTEENGADVKYYPSAEAIQKELPGFIQLGDKDTANGFYDMKFGYAGYETDKIKLEKIHAKLADIDGSETLTVTLSNLPAGTKLTVTSVDNQGNEVLVEVTADSNGQIILTGKDNVVEFKDFELELPKDAKVGTETINVEVTATEKSNGDSKSDSFDFEVTVKDSADLITTMKVEMAGNGDDDIAGIDGSHNVLVGDQGGVQTNFVAGHDYNVAVVLDVSGSMQWNMTYDDKSTPVRMDVAREGLKLFVKEMVNHQGDINLTLITFENASKNLGTFVVNQNNLNDILKTIDGIQAGGGTEPGVGFDEATKWFNKQTNGSENQTYFITDGDPNTVWANLNPRRGEKYISEEEAARQNEVLWKERDANFKPLADTSKVFGVGLGEVKLDNVQRYDNTDVDGNKINDWDSSKRGSSQVLHDKDTLVSYLIGGSENFKPAEAGNDKVTGSNGHDILFGDAINTNHLEWTGRDSVKHPQYSGYSTLIDYLKATVTNGVEPTDQDVYDYLKENYMDFVKADANDPNVKGGNDTIDGGAGNDIIIAGAGNDLVIASQGNDIISTGPGNDTLLYKLLSGLENENTGGHGVDTWVDFALGNPATNDNADVLKFSEDFFTGLKMEDLISSKTVGKFITVDYDEASQTATISVDRDGEGSGYTNETLLHLTNQDTAITLDDLLANNQIVIG